MIGFGELTEIRRNAGMIVTACRDIKAGKPFSSADKIDLESGANLKLLQARDEAHSLEILERVLKSMTKFDPVWETQILTALNKKSPLSREPLNVFLRGLLNPSDGQSNAAFRPNDKVICLRNCHVQPLVKRERTCADEPEWDNAGDEQFLANGEIGRVLQIDPRFAIVAFREDQPDELLTTRIWLPKAKREDDDQEAGTADKFDLAYAISGHKSQGSESPCIIVMIDPAAGMVATREWFYTAISRASKLCLIIGRQDVLWRQIGRQATEKRKTFLVDLLRETR